MSKSNKMFGQKFIIKKAVSYDENPPSMPVTREESEKILGKRVVTMLQVDDVINQMLGEILTVTDASFEDSIRGKAFKDLLRKCVFEALDSFHALSDNQNLA